MTSLQESTAITEFNPQTDDSNNESSSSNQITLDSLPYIDNIHPDYEAYALTLIEEEMQAMGNNEASAPPTEESLLGHLPNPLGSTGEANSIPSFKSSKPNHTLNRNEYESLVSRNGQPRQDKTDYKQKMSAIQPTTTSAAEWKEAIQKAKMELEYERLRMVNVELQSEYESSLWKYQTKKVESISECIKAKLTKQKMNVDQINAKRQDLQTAKAAPKLHVLSQKWDEGINRVKVLSKGVDKLRMEVEDLRRETGVDFSIEKKDDDSDDDDL